MMSIYQKEEDDDLVVASVGIEVRRLKLKGGSWRRNRWRNPGRNGTETRNGRGGINRHVQCL